MAAVCTTATATVVSRSPRESSCWGADSDPHSPMTKGTSISPAPWAVAIQNDHHASREGGMRASARGCLRSTSL